MAHAFLPMTAAQRAAMLDALVNPVPNPDKPRARPRVAESGTCDCGCGPCRLGRHCRHILFCGLGGPVVETELTDADIEFLET